MSWQSQGSGKNYPVFVNNLWKILGDDKNKDIVRYRGNNSFEIVNLNKFTHFLLPRYYKTNKLQQYYKQLERWGFTRPYDNVPIFTHPKWDRTNKDCLNEMSKIETTQIINRGVSHHLRSKTSMHKIMARLDDEIRRREALQNEVSELKKTVNQLMKIVETQREIPSSPTVDPIDKQRQQHGKRKLPSTKRSLGSSGSHSGSPEKKRKTFPKDPEIIFHNANGPNPFVITNTPLTSGKSEPKPRRFALTDLMPSGKQLPTIKHCVNSPEDIPLLRPRSRKVESEIALDSVSLKTEVLQAQINW